MQVSYTPAGNLGLASGSQGHTQHRETPSVGEYYSAAAQVVPTPADSRHYGELTSTRNAGPGPADNPASYADVLSQLHSNPYVVQPN